MKEVEIISRLEQLETQLKNLQHVVENIQRQLGQQATSADNKEDENRPWIEG